MAEGVVDVLEMVEVDHHHRDALSVPPSTGKRLAKAIAQHHSIRQSRQGVVVSKTVNVLQRRDPFSDVFDQREDRGLAAILGTERRIVPLAVANLPIFRVTAKVHATIWTPPCRQIAPAIRRTLTSPS